MRSSKAFSAKFLLPTFILSSLILLPRQSHAIAIVNGQMTGPLIIGAATSGLVGTLSAVFGLAFQANDERTQTHVCMVIFGAAFMSVGIIYLDENTHALQLAEMNPERAKILNLTDEEVYSYASELPLMNALLVHISNGQAKDIESEPSVVWNRFRSELSSETQNALHKISAVLTPAFQIKSL